MISKSLILKNRLGLHARASAKLVALASRFVSHIEIIRGTKTANAKSIMNVMLLGAIYKDSLMVSADGSDEAEVVSAIERLIDSKFGELE